MGPARRGAKHGNRPCEAGFHTVHGPGQNVEIMPGYALPIAILELLLPVNEYPRPLDCRGKLLLQHA